MMHLKVCGLTKLHQVVPLQPWGVTHAGFIFYPPSPRYVLDHLSISEIRSIDTVSKVGVFVNASESEVIQTTEACGLQMIQLHGEEGPDYCRRVGAHIPVMKAFRLDGTETLSSLLAPYEGVCAMFLFDTKGLAYGGTGHKFKWEILKTYDIETPFFLSGGIGPEDAEDILSLSSSPQMKAMIGVDVNSRFETSPGIKDLPAVERFASQLRESKNDNGNYSNVLL